MFNMNFNPNGFTAPKTTQEYIALLDEALRMANDLAEMWSDAIAHVEKSRAVAAA